MELARVMILIKLGALTAAFGLAAVIGAHSIATTVAPSGDFSLLVEIPRAVSSSSSITGFTASTLDTFAPGKSSESTTLPHSQVLENVRMKEMGERPLPAKEASVIVSHVLSESSSTPTSTPHEVATAPSTVSEKECTYATTQFPNYRNLIISEVGWMGTPEDSGSEWIELKNVSGAPLDVGGYWVIDQKEQVKVKLLPTTVPTDGFYLLERGDDAVPAKKADMVYTGALSNSNEGLRIFDSTCFLVDQVEAAPSWPAGNASEKKSMERAANLEWFTYSGAMTGDVFGTPGAQNTAPSTLSNSNAVSNAQSDTTTSSTRSDSESSTTTNQSATTATSTAPMASVLITEVFVGSEQSADDEFIELYNAGDQSVDLTGWSIKKKSSTGTESALVATTRFEGKSIPSHSFFLITHEGKYLGSVSSDATWASSYSLAYTNNAITLYKPDGGVMDSTSWTEITKGQSWARAASSGASFTVGVSTPKQ